MNCINNIISQCAKCVDKIVATNFDKMLFDVIPHKFAKLHHPTKLHHLNNCLTKHTLDLFAQV